LKSNTRVETDRRQTDLY